MGRRDHRDVVGSARNADHHRPLRAGQLRVEPVGAAGDLELVELAAAEVQVQVGCAASNLNRPRDLVRERDPHVAATPTEEMEGRKSRTLVDLQGAGLAVEADGRGILTARIVDMSLVQRVSETPGLNVDGGGSVVDIETRSAQAAQAFR